MNKFTKKPVTIEAVQWTGNNKMEIEAFTNGNHFWFQGCDENPPKLGIRTLEGKLLADIGDWIIRGVKGEFYPCKPDIFEATYDVAKEDSHSNLPPHQQRVVDEKTALDEKAHKLSDFIGNNPIFETLDAEEQERLKVQNDLMWSYSEILGARISAFSA